MAGVELTLGVFVLACPPPSIGSLNSLKRRVIGWSGVVFGLLNFYITVIGG